MSLWFQVVRWKNLLSTGNAFTEVRLDTSYSTLIVGKNGDGKSTIGDAIFLALFGKPFRKVKKHQLINSINGGGTEVEIEFIGHNKKQYVVRRGLKPDFFEIIENGVIIDQEAASKDYQALLENTILKLNFKSFAQIVFLGSAGFVPFMQLSGPLRREIIEDLLDIRIFSAMNSLLKDRVVSNKNLISLKKQELSAAKRLFDVYSEQQKTDDLRSAEVIKECQNKIIHHETMKFDLNVLLLSQESDASNLLSKLTDESKDIETMKKLEEYLVNLKKKRTKLKAGITFFESTKDCPTCKQDISSDFCQDRIVENRTSLDTLASGEESLNKAIDELYIKLNVYEDFRIKLSVANRECDATKNLIRDEETSIRILTKQLEDLNAPKNTDLSEKITEANLSIISIDLEYANALKEKEVLEVSSVILKDDGIKSRIIRQYIPVINQLVGKYLAALDFFVSFELNENFDEVIRSRYRDEFSYESFSEGEKMRIDLAILFTWRAISKLKNSASTNLLILDEVFDASLDSAGCEEFLKLIHSLEDCSVFVISHKTDILVDKFRNIIKFEKNNNFSCIAN